MRTPLARVYVSRIVSMLWLMGLWMEVTLLAGRRGDGCEGRGSRVKGKEEVQASKQVSIPHPRYPAARPADHPRSASSGSPPRA